MIQKTGKKIEVEEKIVICDFCKRDTTARMLGEQTSIEHSGKISITYGYYSHHDGQMFDWDLCSDCAVQVEDLLRTKYPNLPPRQDYI